MGARATLSSVSAPEGHGHGCEVKVDGAWLPVSLTQAHRTYRTAPKRCRVCHGPVMVTGVYTRVPRLSLTHRKAHDGCPLLPGLFSGSGTPHPRAVT